MWLLRTLLRPLSSLRQDRWCLCVVWNSTDCNTIVKASAKTEPLSPTPTASTYLPMMSLKHKPRALVIFTVIRTEQEQPLGSLRRHLAHTVPRACKPDIQYMCFWVDYKFAEPNTASKQTSLWSGQVSGPWQWASHNALWYPPSSNHLNLTIHWQHVRHDTQAEGVRGAL